MRIGTRHLVTELAPHAKGGKTNLIGGTGVGKIHGGIKEMSLTEFRRKELPLAEHGRPGVMVCRSVPENGKPFKGRT